MTEVSRVQILAVGMCLVFVCLTSVAPVTPSTEPDLSDNLEPRGTLEGARLAADQIPDPSLRAMALREIGIAFARSEDRSSSEQVFLGAIQAGSAIANPFERECALCETAEAQAKTGNISAALATAGIIQDDSIRESALRVIANARAKAGDFNGALQITDWLKGGDSSKADVLELIAEAQAKSGDVKGALQTLDGIESYFKPSAKRRFALFMAKAGDQELAKSVFRSAIVAAETNKARWADLAWVQIVEIQAAEGNIQQAFQTAEGIRECYLRSDAFRSIAETQIEAGKFPLAIRAATAMQNEEMKANILAKIAVAQAKSNDLQGALATTEMIGDEPPRCYALYEIASAQAKSGDRNAAAVTFEQAIRTAGAIDMHPDVKSRAYFLIAKAQADSGDVKGALRTAESVRHPNLSDCTLGEIAVAQALSGDVQAGLQITDPIKEEYWKARALRQIAKTQALSGDPKGAVGWARNQILPLSKSYALLGVAEGMLERQEVGKLPARSAP